MLWHITATYRHASLLHRANGPGGKGPHLRGHTRMLDQGLGGRHHLDGSCWWAASLTSLACYHGCQSLCKLGAFKPRSKALTLKTAW